MTLFRATNCVKRIERNFIRQMSSNMLKIPPKAIDSHMHFVEAKFPVPSTAKYHPKEATVQQGIAHLIHNHQLPRLCIVQPSIYGIDNECVTDSIQRLGLENARGVAVIDPKQTSKELLQKYHDKGIRGVRVNLKSNELKPDIKELQNELTELAKIIKPFDWTLQIYCELKVISALHDFIPSLGVKVCFDHFGCTQGSKRAGNEDPFHQEGFQELVSLISNKSVPVYVKISGSYRISDDGPYYKDLENAAKQLLTAGGERCVFASDWPHTKFSRETLESDLHIWMQQCLTWCNDLDNSGQLAKNLFVDNAEKLWDF